MKQLVELLHIKFEKTVTRLREVEQADERIAITGLTCLDDFDMGRSKQRSWTYGQLYNYSRNLAGYLLSNDQPGQKHNRVVATYLGQTMDTVMANIAIHYAGKGFLNIKDGSDIATILDYLDSELYQIDSIITTEEKWNLINEEIIKRISESSLKSNMLSRFGQISLHFIVDGAQSGASNDVSEKNNKFGNKGEDYKIYRVFNWVYPGPLIKKDPVETNLKSEIDSNAIAYVKIPFQGDAKPEVVRHCDIRFDYSVQDSVTVAQFSYHDDDVNFNQMMLTLGRGGVLHICDPTLNKASLPVIEDRVEPPLFHEKFEEMVVKYRDKNAISGVTRLCECDGNTPSETWTYLQLNTKANNLASLLTPSEEPVASDSQHNPGKSIVATYLGRTSDTVLANLAAHKAGAGYLNLNELTMGKDGELEGFEHFLSCLENPANGSYVIDSLVTTWDLWQPIHDRLRVWIEQEEAKPKDQQRKFEIKKLIFLEKVDNDLLKREKPSNDSNKNIEYVTADELSRIGVKCVEFAHSALNRKGTKEAIKFSPYKIHPDTISYIMFSSGTTGKPKGIVIPHRGIMSRIESEIEVLKKAGDKFALSEPSDNKAQENVIQLIDRNVDASFNEVILALGYGGCLKVVDSATIADFEKLRNYFIANNITTTILVPSVWNKLIEKDKDGRLKNLQCLKRIFTTGEAANIDLIRSWLNENRICINAYGPTETTFGLTLNPITKDTLSSLVVEKTQYYIGEDGSENTREMKYIPIGWPMKGTRLLIVRRNSDDKKCPEKFEVLAEIFEGKVVYQTQEDITGELIAIDDDPAIAGVAMGYCNNPEKDILAFIEIERPNVEKQKTEGKLWYETFSGKQRKPAEVVSRARCRAYRTGDMVSLGKEQQLIILGRYDRQIKISGRYPVNLDDIQNLLHEAICKVNGVEYKNNLKVTVVYRHNEYSAIQNNAKEQESLTSIGSKPFDDHHLVAFIEGFNSPNDLDLVQVRRYMRDRMSNSIGIPSRWCIEPLVKSSNDSNDENKLSISEVKDHKANDPQKEVLKTWKAADRKYLSKLWHPETPFKIINRCPPSFFSTTEITQCIISVWKEQLLKDQPNLEIGPQTNYDEIGGSSFLSAVMISTLVSKLGKLGKEYTQIDIHLTSFTKMRTLQSLINDVISSFASNLNDLKRTCSDIEGTNGTLNFILPPMTSSEDLYDRLFSSLENYRCFSYKTVGEVYPKQNSANFVEVGRIYKECLINTMSKERQPLPGRPYLLGGYSSGGIIVFEAARQLTDSADNARQRQAAVILIDSPCPSLVQKMKAQAYIEYITTRFQTRLLHDGNFSFEAENVKKISERGWLDKLNGKDNLTEKQKKEDFLKLYRAHLKECSKAENEKKAWQDNKIEVMLNHLKAELVYEIDENTNVNFQCQLITSKEFTEFFEKDDIYIEGSFKNEEERKAYARRLGWPAKCFTEIPDIKGEKASALVSTDIRDHADLIKAGNLGIDSYIVHSKKFIENSKKLIIAGAIRSKVEKFCQEKKAVLVAQNERKYAVESQYLRGNNLDGIHSAYKVSIFIDFKMLSTPLLPTKDLIGDYLSAIPGLEKTESDFIKENMCFAVEIDHIYDKDTLVNLHNALTESLKKYQDRVRIITRIEPQVFARFTEQKLLGEAIDALSIPDEKRPDSMVSMTEYISARYRLLSHQWINPIEESEFIALTMRYILNLDACFKREITYDPGRIDFALLLPTVPKDIDNFITNLMPKIITAQDDFYHAIRFCSPLHLLLTSGNLKIKESRIFAHFNQHDEPVKLARKRDAAAVDRLLKDFFRPEPSRSHLLMINNFSNELNKIEKSFANEAFSNLSSVWCEKILIDSIALVRTSKSPDKHRLKFYINALLCIYRYEIYPKKDYALSLLISLLKDMIPHDSIINIFQPTGNEKRPNLKWANLTDLDTKLPVSIDLSNLTLKSKCAFENITFNAVSFSSSSFHGATFNNCKFINCNLDDCVFIGCEFSHCSFENVSLYGAQFNNGTRIFSLTKEEKVFDNCNLIRVEFREAYLSNVNFYGSILLDSKFVQAELKGCQFENSEVTGITFDNLQSGSHIDLLSSLTHEKLPINNFKECETSHFKIPIQLIDAESLEEFIARSSNFEIKRTIKTVVTSQKLNELEKIRTILERGRKGHLGLNEAYKKVLNMSIPNHELELIQSNKKAEKALKNRSEQGAESTSRITMLAQSATNFIKKGKQSVFVQETQLEITRTAKFQQESTLENMRLISDLDFIEASAPAKPTKITHSSTLSIEDQLIQLKLPKWAISKNGYCWLYRPKKSAFSLMLSQNPETLLYSNVAHALSMTPCIRCQNTVCDCSNCEDTTRDIEIIRIHISDLQLCDYNYEMPVLRLLYEVQEIFLHSLYQSKSLMACDVIGTLKVTPNLRHPLFLKRSEITNIPTLQQYNDALNQKTFYKVVPELKLLLEMHNMVVNPLLAKVRIRLLKRLVGLLKSNPPLEIGGKFTKTLVEEEISSFPSDQIIHADTLLMAARSLIAFGASAEAKRYYVAYLECSTLEHPEILKEIASIRKLSSSSSLDSIVLPMQIADQAKQQKNDDKISYADAYYDAQDDGIRKKMLSAYMEERQPGCSRLIINRSGQRINEFDYMKDDSLIRAVVIISNSMTPVSIITADENISASVQDDWEVYERSEELNESRSEERAQSEEPAARRRGTPIFLSTFRDRIKEIKPVKVITRAVTGTAANIREFVSIPVFVQYAFHYQMIEQLLTPTVVKEFNKPFTNKRFSIKKLSKDGETGERVSFLKLQNPMEHFRISFLMKRLHGFVLNQHYVHIVKRHAYGYALSEAFQPISSIYDDLPSSYSLYALTWKLFELCILGQKYTESYAAKKCYIDVNGKIDGYPLYCEESISLRGEKKINWTEVFTTLSDQPLDKLAIKELQFLDIEEVVNGWLNDDKIFKESILRKLHDDETLDHWEKTPGIEARKIYEQLYALRNFLSSRKPEDLVFKKFFKEFFAYVIKPNHKDGQVKARLEQIEADNIRQEIWDMLVKRTCLHNNLGYGGDSKLLQDVAEKYPQMILQLIERIHLDKQEFKDLKENFQNFKILMEKHIASGGTYLPLNGVTQEQLNDLHQNGLLSGVRDLEFINCKEPVVFDAAKFPILEHFSASGCQALEIQAGGKYSTTLDEATVITKFTGGNTSELEKIIENLSKNAEVKVTDPDHCEQKAKAADEQNQSKRAIFYSKAALVEKPDDAELLAIKQRHTVKKYRAESLEKAISDNNVDQFTVLMSESQPALQATFDENTLQRLLLSAVEKKHEDIVIKVLDRKVDPFMELLIAAVKYHCDDVVAKIIATRRLNANEMNDERVSPLLQAVISGNDYAALLLVQHGANVGRSLKKALSCGSTEEIIQALIQPNAIISKSDIPKLVLRAAKKCNLKVLGWLVDRDLLNDLPQNDKARLRELLDKIKAEHEADRALLLSVKRSLKNDQVNAVRDEEVDEVSDHGLTVNGLRSCVSGNGKIKATLTDTSIIFIDIRTNKSVKKIKCPNISDIVQMSIDHNGEHVLLMSHSELSLINRMIESIPITWKDLSSLRAQGVTLTHDGSLLVLHTLAEKKKLTFVRSSHLCNPSDELRSILNNKNEVGEASSLESCEIVVSEDNKFFAATIDSKNVAVGRLSDQETMSILECKHSVIKLQIRKNDGLYIICAMTESEFYFYEIRCEKDQYKIKKKKGGVFRDLQEDGSEESNPSIFVGDKLVNFTIDASSSGVIFIDDKNTFYWKPLSKGVPIRLSLSSTQVYLSDGGYIIYSDNKGKLDHKTVDKNGQLISVPNAGNYQTAALDNSVKEMVTYFDEVVEVERNLATRAQQLELYKKSPARAMRESTLSCLAKGERENAQQFFDVAVAKDPAIFKDNFGIVKTDNLLQDFQRLVDAVRKSKESAKQAQPDEAQSQPQGVASSIQAPHPVVTKKLSGEHDHQKYSFEYIRVYHDNNCGFIALFKKTADEISKFYMPENPSTEQKEACDNMRKEDREKGVKILFEAPQNLRTLLLPEMYDAYTDAEDPFFKKDDEGECLLNKYRYLGGEYTIDLRNTARKHGISILDSDNDEHVFAQMRDKGAKDAALSDICEQIHNQKKLVDEAHEQIQKHVLRKDIQDRYIQCKYVDNQGHLCVGAARVIARSLGCNLIVWERDEKETTLTYKHYHNDQQKDPSLRDLHISYRPGHWDILQLKEVRPLLPQEPIKETKESHQGKIDIQDYWNKLYQCENPADVLDRVLKDQPYAMDDKKIQDFVTAREIVSRSSSGNAVEGYSPAFFAPVSSTISKESGAGVELMSSKNTRNMADARTRMDDLVAEIVKGRIDIVPALDLAEERCGDLMKKKAKEEFGKTRAELSKLAPSKHLNDREEASSLKSPARFEDSLSGATASRTESVTDTTKVQEKKRKEEQAIAEVEKMLSSLEGTITAVELVKRGRNVLSKHLSEEKLEPFDNYINKNQSEQSDVGPNKK